MVRLYLAKLATGPAVMSYLLASGCDPDVRRQQGVRIARMQAAGAALSYLLAAL